MSKIINLTGITIAYRDRGEIKHIEPSGLRLVANRRFIDTHRSLGDASIVYVQHDLPEALDLQFPPRDGVLYIVDPVIAAAMVEFDVRRDDVLVSHGATAERDNNNQVVASRRFLIANPETLVDVD